MSLKGKNTPIGWPGDVAYLREPVHTHRQAVEQSTITSTPAAVEQGLVIIKLPILPCPLVSIRTIDDSKHPAYGEHGLFARRRLEPDTFILLYLGLVHSNDASDTDDASSYDLSVDREAGISVDAAEMGTEARFINDYRGVRSLGPNAEFRDVFMVRANGVAEKGVGVFVLGAGKSGKRKVGIKAGEEIVVSYGKGFWQERRANAVDVV